VIDVDAVHRAEEILAGLGVRRDRQAAIA
jgi:hypothetical protein